VLDDILEQEEKKLQEEERIGDLAIKQLEFERDFNLLLVDALY